MAQAVSRLWRPTFAPESVYVGLVVDEVALGQFFSEFLGFPLSLLFNRVSPYSYIIWGGGGGWWLQLTPPTLRTLDDV
jgi:hypothetical protein